MLRMGALAPGVIGGVAPSKPAKVLVRVSKTDARANQKALLQQGFLFFKCCTVARTMLPLAMVLQERTTSRNYSLRSCLKVQASADPVTKAVR